MTAKELKHLALMCALTLMAFSTVAVRAQSPGFSIDLNLTNFETGVSKPNPESFVTERIGCNFDNWQVAVNWGDGQPEHLTQSGHPTGSSTLAGTYAGYSVHSYAKSGTYSATAQLYIHCVGDPAGSPGAMRDTKSYAITVFDRLPLRILTLSSTTVKRGGTLDVTTETFADAPVTGTRVDFTAGTAGVFGSSKTLGYADILVNSKTTTKTLTVLPTAPLGSVAVTVTAGSSITKTVKIVP